MKVLKKEQDGFNININEEPQESKNLLDLPNEIIMKIFSFFNIKENAQMSLVNKFIYQMANDEALWKLYCQRDHEVSKKLDYQTTWKSCYQYNNVPIQFHNLF